MREQLIKFETAKLAEEKGFEEYCKDYYTEKGAFIEGVGNYNGVDNDKVFSYSAPTQSLLQKWLREVHNINMHIVEGGYKGKYVAFVSPTVHGYIYDGLNHVKNFNSYELALEAALIEGLNMIKDGDNTIIKD